MARIYRHFLLSAPLAGLTYSFERVESAADCFQVRESATIKQRIIWEARNADGELVYHGTFYRCYDRDAAHGSRLSYECDIYRKKTDGNMMLINEKKLTAERAFIIKNCRDMITAWSDLDCPNYIDQKNLEIRDGVLKSATPAADTARAQADRDIATGSDVAPLTVKAAPLTVKAAPLNWSAAMPIIITALEHGTPEGKALARAELMELAAKLDEQNNSSNIA